MMHRRAMSDMSGREEACGVRGKPRNKRAKLEGSAGLQKD